MEMTPNPATMKFVANKYLITNSSQAEYTSQVETKESSPLAEALFNFPFVQKVFISGNYVAITKNDSIQWDYINMELREFLKEFIEQGNVAVVKLPEPKVMEKSDKPQKVYDPSEYDEVIVGLLEEYVRPAVENDGGAIDYLGYDNGLVTVKLKGACSGCPSSTMTLRGGIENLLKQHIPDIKAVVAEEE